ncbi:MAG: hypothetical protein HC905_05450 [Bacteroidales bacterium]|nr:hypothetical protein [Bacteroidales bacterium]
MKFIIKIKSFRFAFSGLILLLFFHSQVQAQNLVSNHSLNGQWDLEESIDSVNIPKSFTHKVVVPGLTNQSVPQFKDVDNYTTSDIRFNQLNFDVKLELLDTGGVTIQKRKA